MPSELKLLQRIANAQPSAGQASSVSDVNRLQRKFAADGGGAAATVTEVTLGAVCSDVLISSQDKALWVASVTGQVGVAGTGGQNARIFVPAGATVPIPAWGSNKVFVTNAVAAEAYKFAVVGFAQGV